MWEPGEIAIWREVYNQRIWHAQSMIVVKDLPEEVALALLPGSEAVTPEGYADGKQNLRRRWDFKNKPWKLESYIWHTNRLLCLIEPHRYYSTMLFWNGESNRFLCYYINFQLPFQRNHRGVDTLDLELDLIINPDLSYEWKDLHDYRKAFDNGVILREWAEGIENAKQELMEKIEKRQYPLDGSWLDWKPDSEWAPPKLPANWDQV